MSLLEKLAPHIFIAVIIVFAGLMCMLFMSTLTPSVNGKEPENCERIELPNQFPFNVDWYLCDFRLPDGRKIECLVQHNFRRYGLSCNWGGLK